MPSGRSRAPPRRRASGSNGAIWFHASFALRHRVYLRVYYRDARHLSEAARRVHRGRADTYRDLWTRLMTQSGVAEDDDEALVLTGC